MALRSCVAFTFPLAYCGIILFPPVSDKDELVLEIEETKLAVVIFTSVNCLGQR